MANKKTLLDDFKSSAEYRRPPESENTIENVMYAYMNKGQSLKWICSMLEMYCSNSMLLQNPELRKSEIIRIIEKTLK